MAPDGVVCDDTMTTKREEGGFDPHARIPDMDADGSTRRSLSEHRFFRRGRGSGSCMRYYHAYNVVGGLLQALSDRLLGSMLPLHSVEADIQEMHFARKRARMPPLIRPNP